MGVVERQRGEKYEYNWQLFPKRSEQHRRFSGNHLSYNSFVLAKTWHDRLSLPSPSIFGTSWWELSTGRNKVGTVEISQVFASDFWLKNLEKWLGQKTSGERNSFGSCTLGKHGLTEVKDDNIWYQNIAKLLEWTPLRQLGMKITTTHNIKVTFVFCQGQLCFICENISPVSKFQIFWIIPILSITFLSRNVCFITMKFIHTIWHSLLWHMSLVKKHGWLERHGNPSCATHPLKMVNFHSHVQFPEGIPPKTNSHFSDPRFSSIWRIQNHLPFLGFVSPLGFRCQNVCPQALPHEEDLVDVPRDVSKRWAWAWNFAICSCTSVTEGFHE